MLATIKLILGIQDNTHDNLLNELIAVCLNDASLYTHWKSDWVMENMESVLISMVVFRYQSLGSAGLKSESYSGVTFEYTSDYPAEILKVLDSCRKLRCY